MIGFLTQSWGIDHDVMEDDADAEREPAGKPGGRVLTQAIPARRARGDRDGARAVAPPNGARATPPLAAEPFGLHLDAPTGADRADTRDHVAPTVAAEALAIGMEGDRRELPWPVAVARRFAPGTVDLARVQAFFGKPAEAACALLDVDAFSVGDVIVFGRETPPLETVVHEVTHVVQSGATPIAASAIPADLQRVPASDASEREARTVERGRGGPVRRAALGLRAHGGRPTSASTPAAPLDPLALDEASLRQVVSRLTRQNASRITLAFVSQVAGVRGALATSANRTAWKGILTQLSHWLAVLRRHGLRAAQHAFEGGVVGAYLRAFKAQLRTLDLGYHVTSVSTRSSHRHAFDIGSGGANVLVRPRFRGTIETKDLLGWPARLAAVATLTLVSGEVSYKARGLSTDLRYAWRWAFGGRFRDQGAKRLWWALRHPHAITLTSDHERRWFADLQQRFARRAMRHPIEAFRRLLTKAERRAIFRSLPAPVGYTSGNQANLKLRYVAPGVEVTVAYRYFHLAQVGDVRSLGRVELIDGSATLGRMGTTGSSTGIHVHTPAPTWALQGGTDRGKTAVVALHPDRPRPIGGRPPRLPDVLPGAEIGQFEFLGPAGKVVVYRREVRALSVRRVGDGHLVRARFAIRSYTLGAAHLPLDTWWSTTFLPVAYVTGTTAPAMASLRAAPTLDGNPHSAYLGPHKSLGALVDSGAHEADAADKKRRRTRPGERAKGPPPTIPRTEGQIHLDLVGRVWWITPAFTGVPGQGTHDAHERATGVINETRDGSAASQAARYTRGPGWLARAAGDLRLGRGAVQALVRYFTAADVRRLFEHLARPGRAARASTIGPAPLAGTVEAIERLLSAVAPTQLSWMSLSVIRRLAPTVGEAAQRVLAGRAAAALSPALADATIAEFTSPAAKVDLIRGLASFQPQLARRLVLVMTSRRCDEATLRALGRLPTRLLAVVLTRGTAGRGVRRPVAATADRARLLAHVDGEALAALVSAGVTLTRLLTWASADRAALNELVRRQSPADVVRAWPSTLPVTSLELDLAAALAGAARGAHKPALAQALDRHLPTAAVAAFRAYHQAVASARPAAGLAAARATLVERFAGLGHASVAALTSPAALGAASPEALARVAMTLTDSHAGPVLKAWLRSHRGLLRAVIARLGAGAVARLASRVDATSRDALVSQLDSGVRSEFQLARALVVGAAAPGAGRATRRELDQGLRALEAPTHRIRRDIATRRRQLRGGSHRQARQRLAREVRRLAAIAAAIVRAEAAVTSSSTARRLAGVRARRTPARRREARRQLRQARAAEGRHRRRLAALRRQLARRSRSRDRAQRRLDGFAALAALRRSPALRALGGRRQRLLLDKLAEVAVESRLKVTLSSRAGSGAPTWTKARLGELTHAVESSKMRWRRIRGADRPLRPNDLPARPREIVLADGPTSVDLGRGRVVAGAGQAMARFDAEVAALAAQLRSRAPAVLRRARAELRRLHGPTLLHVLLAIPRVDGRLRALRHVPAGTLRRLTPAQVIDLIHGPGDRAALARFLLIARDLLSRCVAAATPSQVVALAREIGVDDGDLLARLLARAARKRAPGMVGALVGLLQAAALGRGAPPARLAPVVAGWLRHDLPATAVASLFGPGSRLSGLLVDHRLLGRVAKRLAPAPAVVAQMLPFWVAGSRIALVRALCRHWVTKRGAPSRAWDVLKSDSSILGLLDQAGRDHRRQRAFARRLRRRWAPRRTRRKKRSP